MAMTSRRQLKRRHLIYYLRVFDDKTNRLLGHLVDITTEGMMVMSEELLDIHETYTCRMMLPEPIEGKAEVVFDATALWSRPDVNPDFYVTGFHLKPLPPKITTIIEELIEDAGFEDGEFEG